MGAPAKLIGRRFRSLLVLDLLGTDSGGNRVWLCRCDCGQDRDARTSQLQGGEVTCCGREGCKPPRRKRAAKPKPKPAPRIVVVQPECPYERERMRVDAFMVPDGYGAGQARVVRHLRGL